MLNSTELLKIISGRRNDLPAIAVRFGLGLLTPVYRLGIWWRNLAFDRGWSRIHRVSIPVISIGNLTTGGTGKTPLTVWISKWLASRGKRVALISRGYGARNTGAPLNDEAMELEHRLGDVPHVQDPDRFKMAQLVIETFNAEVIVLDDGFQHRRLARDFDIVIIDATEPFGFGHLIPRGLLREPISSLSRADAIVLSRADAVDVEVKNAIRTRVRAANPAAHWAETRTRSKCYLQFDGTELPLEHLRGRRVATFCGIGNPAGFQHSLQQLKIEILAHTDFPDHHGFTLDELQQLGKKAVECRAEALVCTHKDLVKIGANRIDNIPLYALLIDVEFLNGESGLCDLIDQLF